MIYLNLKKSEGVETIDELNKKDFDSTKDFRTELRRLAKEYRLAGMQVYISQRSTKEWRER